VRVANQTTAVPLGEPKPCSDFRRDRDELRLSCECDSLARVPPFDNQRLAIVHSSSPVLVYYTHVNRLPLARLFFYPWDESPDECSALTKRSLVFFS